MPLKYSNNHNLFRIDYFHTTAMHAHRLLSQVDDKWNNFLKQCCIACKWSDFLFDEHVSLSTDKQSMTK